MSMDRIQNDKKQVNYFHVSIDTFSSKAYPSKGNFHTQFLNSRIKGLRKTFAWLRAHLIRLETRNKRVVNV